MYNPETQMAYVISMDGAKNKEIVQDYILKDAEIDPGLVTGCTITISENRTGINDYQISDSGLYLKSDAGIVITQELVFDAVHTHSGLDSKQFYVCGTTYEVHDHQKYDHLSTAPIEECNAYYLVCRSINSNTPILELLTLLQQLFWISKIHHCWFWNYDHAPGRKALKILVKGENVDELADFLIAVDPQNRMDVYNQLILLAWELIHNHKTWLSQNTIIIDALLKNEDFPDHLIENLQALRKD